jgi:hypothetical protein
MEIIKRIKKILNLKIEIPWFKINKYKEGEKRPEELLILKSYFKIGQTDCAEIKIADSPFEKIEIEKKDDKYFLTRTGSDPMEIFPNDLVDLGKTKLKVKMGQINFPLYMPIVVLLSLFCIMAFIGPGSDDYPEENSEPEVTLAQRLDEKKEAPRVNKPIEKENQLPSEKSSKVPIPDNFVNKRSQVISKGAGLEEFYCSIPGSKNPQLCDKAREVENWVRQAKAAIISGDMQVAKQDLSIAQRGSALFSKTRASSINGEIEMLLAEINSFECELALKKENLADAKEKCQRSLQYDPSNLKAKTSLKRLELFAKRLFYEGYVWEEQDSEKAIEVYKRVLAIADPDGLYYGKAKKRIASLEAREARNLTE